MRRQIWAAASVLSALAVCACTQEGGRNATPFDGNYPGNGWVVGGPAQCGAAAPVPTRLQVVNGMATVQFTSIGVRGPVGPNGELNQLRSTGMQPLQSASSTGQISAGAANVTYRQDLCTWRFQGQAQS